MNVGLYQGAASIAAAQRMQAIVSENIASASIPGFQKSEASFDAALGETTRLGSGGLPKELAGSVPQLISRISRSGGELRSTSNELDFAISGRGYFQVQKADGSTGYTRDGEFHLSPERTLITKQGFTVMGDGGPLTLRPEGGRLSITPEGRLVQGEVPVGRLNIVDFADDQPLKRVGDGLLDAENGAAPQPVEQVTVLNGTLESSNVQPMQEMVNLITISRAYEASQKVVTAHDEALDKAIQILGNPNA